MGATAQAGGGRGFGDRIYFTVEHIASQNPWKKGVNKTQTSGRARQTKAFIYLSPVGDRRIGTGLLLKHSAYSTLLEFETGENPPCLNCLARKVHTVASFAAFSFIIFSRSVDEGRSSILHIYVRRRWQKKKPAQANKRAKGEMRAEK